MKLCFRDRFAYPGLLLLNPFGVFFDLARGFIWALALPAFSRCLRAGRCCLVFWGYRGANYLAMNGSLGGFRLTLGKMMI